jgi:hypothetical protein
MEKIKKQEKDLAQKMWLMEREKKMEAIVKKKIELQRVRDQTAVFDDLQRKKKLEMEVIDQMVTK